MKKQISSSLKKFNQNTFSSLKIRNYRLYFLGQSISLSGTWMQTIGQAWLVLKLTNSGTALGLVTALQFLPVLLFGAMGGVIADRLSKRKILYFTQIGSALLALILGFLVTAGMIKLWMLYILAWMLGVINSVDSPARRTFVMEMVGPKQLSNAVTLFSTAFNLSRIIGPAIAGAIIAAFGLAPCFFINAFSYLAVILSLFKMRNEELHPVDPVKRAKGQLREGLKYVKDMPLLRNLLIMVTIVGTLTFEFQVNLPIFAKYTFKTGADGYALLNTAMGIGAVTGGILIAGRKIITTKNLIYTSFIFGTCIILTAISPTIHIAILMMIIVGIFLIQFTSYGESMLQLESSPNMRSRVMSLWSIAFLGSTPIGGLIIGWIGEYASPRWGLTVSGFAAIIAGAYGFVKIKDIKLKSTQTEFLEPIPVEDNKGA
ncbi:MAG: MFS transporter [Ignavibacteriaceae bacterium]